MVHIRALRSFAAAALVTAGISGVIDAPASLAHIVTAGPGMHAASGKTTLSTRRDPAIEQQIEIQDTNLVTTSTAYTDASGSGSFLWDSSRYSGLQHVYFEAGIANADLTSSTSRIRSSDIGPSLVSGTRYKVRTKYGCVYDHRLRAFTETGYAELWSSNNSVEVTSSAVQSPIATGSGRCPTTPTPIAVRFSRLIILQADPSRITDTNTVINIGQDETVQLPDRNDHPMAYPKIWTFTDHRQHPAAGWDSIKDVLFSATLASPAGTPVSACLFDITAEVEETCVTTSSTTPSYIASSDIAPTLQDGHQYETYLQVSTPHTPVALYNAYVTVEQSNPAGLSNIELYHAFNPYPFSAARTDGYTPGYFLNDWEPTNFAWQLDNSDLDNEILAFHLETTEKVEASSPNTTATAALLETCSPKGGCAPDPVLGATMQTSSTAFVAVSTPSEAFLMPTGGELDLGLEVKEGSGTTISTGSWLVIDVNLLPSYPVQLVSGIPYGPNAGEVLDRCVPVGASPGRPGVVFIHGGGWTKGSRSSYDATCETYASQGYVATTIDYRLTSSTPSESNSWPDQIGDVQLAVRYMRATAGETGLDVNHICAAGDSAGAHLSLLLDELHSIHPSDVASLYPNESPAVQCVVDEFGPTDLAALYYQNPSVDKFIYQLLDFQTPRQDPAIYRDASPVDNIGSQTGPALIIQGTQDTTVLPDQSSELQRDLQAADVLNEFYEYVGGHEFSGLTTAQIAISEDQVNAFVLSMEHP